MHLAVELMRESSSTLNSVGLNKLIENADDAGTIEGKQRGPEVISKSKQREF